MAPLATTGLIADLLQLCKPPIVVMSVLVTAGGMWLAPGLPAAGRSAVALAGVALAVAAACMFNMLIERHSDRLMERTRDRPLPAGRLSARTVGALATASAALALAVLWRAVNPLTAALTAAALVLYGFVYTPLKRRTSLAFLIGTIPGALPPVTGWAAATGRVEPPALILFALIVLWQLPHVLAISVLFAADYERAGIQTPLAAWGRRPAMAVALVGAAALIPAALLPTLLGHAGWVFAAAGMLLGFWQLAEFTVGLRGEPTLAWGRRYFRVSLVYIGLLTAALLVDRGLASI